MAENNIEKSICGKCGSDIRSGTTFCYNCGGQIARSQPLVAEPIKPEKIDESESTKTEKLSRAAKQRRKARVVQRRSNEYTWEPAENSNLTLLIAVLITVAALAVAYFAVHWR